MHAYIHTYINSIIHICIRTYIHTYIHACMYAADQIDRFIYWLINLLIGGLKDVRKCLIHLGRSTICPQPYLERDRIALKVFDIPACDLTWESLPLQYGRN